jgi:hypothetical protein
MNNEPLLPIAAARTIGLFGFGLGSAMIYRCQNTTSWQTQQVLPYDSAGDGLGATRRALTFWIPDWRSGS